MNGISELQLKEVKDIVDKTCGSIMGVGIIKATLTQLFNHKEALCDEVEKLHKQLCALKWENLNLKRQNEKYKSVLTSELHSVYEVRQSKWGKRRTLDPIIAVHCTKHEAMTICQQFNKAFNKDGIYFYMVKEGDI